MADQSLDIPVARRETRDVSGRFIAGAFFTVLSGVAAVGLLCWWILPGPIHDIRIPYPPPAYPTPRLQASPPQDMARFYRQEMAELNSYGWIDRDKGVVHIPIDQAMRIIAKEGIKDWPAPGMPLAAAPTRLPPGPANP